MIKMLSLGAVALAGAGLLVAPAVAATPSASGAAPHQAGYVGVPASFHTAKVTVRVPTLHCTSGSTGRTVQLGLFGTEVQAGAVRPVSLAVEAACVNGSARYRAVYRNRGGGGMRVHHGDIVVLSIEGVESFAIDDRTTGEGSGGAGGEGGPGATHPKAERPVLIGAQWTGRRPAGVTGDFRNPTVNHKKLVKVAHHKRGNSPATRVGSLRAGRFRITFAPHRAR